MAADDDAMTACNSRNDSMTEIDEGSPHRSDRCTMKRDSSSIDESSKDSPATCDGEKQAAPLQKGISLAFSVDDPIWVEFAPGDPGDPRNFSKSRKWMCSAVGISFCGLVSMSVSGYAICLQSVIDELHTSREIALLGLTLFTAMFGSAPLLLAPLSELYGRNGIYFASALVFTLFMIPQALAKNIATMLVSRFISGIAGSTAVSLVGGTLTDVWSDSERSFPMALFSFAAFATVGLGATAFGFVEQTHDFRLMSWIMFALSGFFTILIVVLLKETRASVLLTRRAAKLRESTGDKRYRCIHEEKRGTFLQMLATNLSRPLRLLLTEPVLAAFSIWISFAWGCLYIQLESIQSTFADVYGFTISQSGLVFLTQLIGAALAVLVDLYCTRIYLRTVSKRGPEARLYTAMAGAFALPTGLWIYTWTMYPHINWIVPCIGLVFQYSGMQLVYISVFNYIGDSYDRYASSALSAQSFLRNLVGAVCPLFTQQMFRAMGIQGAGSLVSACGTLLSVTPFLLFKYGSRLRARSKFSQEMQRLKEREAKRNELIASQKQTQAQAPQEVA